MDEEPLTALEKDIRTVDENIKSLTKKAEEIERDIADTSDPEGIKALRQRLDVIDQKEILLREKENILLRERANLRGQASSGHNGHLECCAGAAQMKRSTRRKHRPPGASAAGLPEELRGLRSSRKGLAQDDGDTGDGDNGDAPEPEAPEPEASVGRPRRERKRKVRSDSAYRDWVCSYPNEPVPSDYRLGEVETISGGFWGGSDAAERPMSLRLQSDIQRTRKASPILVEESRTEAPPPAPPRAPQQQHDESAMSPQTPEELHKNYGECKGDRHPSALIESAPNKGCCTRSGDSSRGAGKPVPVTKRRRLLSTGCSQLEEVISVEAKKVKKVRKKPKSSEEEETAKAKGKTKVDSQCKAEGSSRAEGEEGEAGGSSSGEA